MPQLLGAPQLETTRATVVEEGRGAAVVVEVEARGGGALLHRLRLPQGLLLWRSSMLL